MPILAATLAVGGLRAPLAAPPARALRLLDLALACSACSSAFYTGGMGLGVVVPLGAVTLGLLFVSPPADAAAARSPAGAHRRSIAALAALAAVIVRLAPRPPGGCTPAGAYSPNPRRTRARPRRTRSSSSRC